MSDEDTKNGKPLPLPIDGSVEDVPYETEAEDAGYDGDDTNNTNDTTHATIPTIPTVPSAPVTSTETPRTDVEEGGGESATKRRRVRKWSAVESVAFADALTRQDDVFVARLKTPMYILSPTVRLRTALFDDDEELCDYATLKMKSTHLNTFQAMEETLLNMAKANKSTWFGNDEITDGFLETSLKRFVDASNKTMTVKIDEGLSGRTNVTPGTRVKVVLACDQALFTKTQFGVPWTMHVVRSIENDENMYLFDAEEDVTYASVSNDLFSHLAQDRSDLADAL